MRWPTRAHRVSLIVGKAGDALRHDDFLTMEHPRLAHAVYFELATCRPVHADYTYVRRSAPVHG